MCTSLMLVSNQAVMWALRTRKTGTFVHFYSISLCLSFFFFFNNPKSYPRLCLQPWTSHVLFIHVWKGGVCTFAQFCCDSIFQSAKDLGARREVIITDVTAEMWQEPIVPYVSLFVSLPRACRAPFKGSPAWLIRDYRGRQLVPLRWLSALLSVMR